MKEEKDYPDIFSHEREIQDRMLSLFNDEEPSFSDLKVAYFRLIEEFNRLLKYTRKLTKTSDANQRKLIKLRDELQRQNDQIQLQKEELEFLNHQLAEASLTDQLTGLHNRRFVVNFMEKDVENALRAYFSSGVGEAQKQDILFFLLDLDHFKKVNDHYGHHAGDLVLSEFAQLLRGHCRKGDIAVRWGGEEFMLVFRQSNREHGEALAEKIRKEVMEQPFKLPEGGSLHLTCSIGFAPFPFSLDEPNRWHWEQVVALADTALYGAKNTSRNAWIGVKPTEKLLPEDQSLADMLQNGLLEIGTSIPPQTPINWQ